MFEHVPDQRERWIRVCCFPCLFCIPYSPSFTFYATGLLGQSVCAKVICSYLTMSHHASDEIGVMPHAMCIH